MPNEVLLWLLGGFATAFVAALVAGLKSYANLSERVTRLEAVMSLFGQKAAKILHNDDDAHGMDSLLDKYLDRHYELCYDEWQELLAKCALIENDKSKAKGERTLAAFLGAICSHKLMYPPQAKRDMDDLSDEQRQGPPTKG